MIRKYTYYGALALLWIVMPSAARAQQVPQLNFTMTPPPIVSPTFERGVTTLKMRVSSSTMDGVGIGVRGAGFEGVVRSSFGDQLAADMQIGLFGMEGGTQDVTLLGGALFPTHSDITVGEALLGANAEMLLFRRGGMSALLFAGPEISVLYGTVKSTWATAGPPPAVASDTAKFSGYLYGVQGGGTAGFKLGEFHLDGYAAILRETGRATISWPSLGKFGGDIPSTTVSSWGIELVYLPWNLTAGILVQTKGSHERFQAVRTHIYHISWTF